MKPIRVILRTLPAIFFICLLASSSTMAQKRRATPAKTSAVAAQAELKRFEVVTERFARHGHLISDAMWALIHTYSSKSHLDQAMDLLQKLLDAMAKKDSAGLRSVGGLDGLMNRFLLLMRSDKDDMVAGFSARVLAVIGGARFGPEILALIETRDASWTDPEFYPPRTARGHAAIALSVLEIPEHKPKIAALLKSQNRYDRSGAAYALGHLKAKEYAPEVAGLLLINDFGSRRDISPILSLIEMGVGDQYKKEFAAALGEDFDSEVHEAAAYALARLRALEYAPQIAKLLEGSYRRGEAAKALAIMGAKEYVPQIARLLEDDRAPLDQSDALLALGVLKAERYVPVAASLMRTNRESFVRTHAAEFLILLSAQEYAKEAMAILAVNQTGTYIHAGNFHPLVAEDARRINDEFLSNLKRLKAPR